MVSLLCNCIPAEVGGARCDCISAGNPHRPEATCICAAGESSCAAHVLMSTSRLLVTACSCQWHLPSGTVLCQLACCNEQVAKAMPAQGSCWLAHTSLQTHQRQPPHSLNKYPQNNFTPSSKQQYQTRAQAQRNSTSPSQQANGHHSTRQQPH